LRRKAKETLKRAYLGAKTNNRDAQKSDETCIIGSTSVMIIEGETVQWILKCLISRLCLVRQTSSGVAYRFLSRQNWLAQL